MKQDIRKSDDERKEVKKYAIELVDKVKRDEESAEFMIDRRMINKFLVQFVNQKSSY